MKKIIIALFILIPTLISAQNIKYYNVADFEVDKENAEFYKEFFTDETKDSTVLVKKFKISGKLVETGYYSKNNLNIKNGLLMQYGENGNVNYIKHYKNNKLDGKLIGYYESGQIRRTEIYNSDSLVEGKCFTKTGTDTTYYESMILPTFKGRHFSKIRDFIAVNLRYPGKARKRGIKGDVYVYFEIDKNGILCDPKIVYSDNELLNSESLRIIKKSSKYWKAGYCEGELANISFTIPFKYRMK